MVSALNYLIIPITISNLILLFSVLQDYNNLLYGQPDIENKTHLYGCGDYSGLFHCDPLSSKVTSYAIAGNETEIYPVTRNDSTYVASRHGNAVEIVDKNREFIEIANNPDYNSNHLSVSFWVKGISSPNDKYGHVISHVNKNNTAGWFFDFISLANDNPKIRFVVSNSSGNTIPSNDIPVSNSTFVNIIGIINGSEIKVYKDGNLFQELEFEGNYTSDPRLPIHIGSGAFCSSCERMSGFIDDLRLYNRAITESEVKELFTTNSSDVVLNGLAGYWKFDDSLRDESGANNHGKMFTPIGSMAFAPDGRMFFTEKNTGRIMVMKDNYVSTKPFAIIPDIYVNWEQGLLGLAIDPNFENNHYVYLYYTTTEYEEPVNRVVRFTAVNDTATNKTILMDDIPASRGFHSGGALIIGPDEKLYITVGDATEDNSAQSPSVLTGKILRINKDGTIPSDNPFPNSPIFTLGHRNMYGIAFDAENRIGIITENGDLHYDEINMIQNGGNYGFPTLQPPNIPPELSNSSSIKPLRSYWVTIAPTQALYYLGDKFPLLNGSFLFGTYTGDIYSLGIDNQSKKAVSETHINLGRYPFEPVIGIAQSPSGNIYSGSYHINRLDSVDIDNKMEEIFPIEITTYSDINIDNLEFSDESITIDLHRNTTENPSRAITVGIPPSMIHAISEVSVFEPAEAESFQDRRLVRFVSDEVKNSVHMELPRGENLRLTINHTLSNTSRIPSIEISENLYDAFDNNTYTLGEGQLSPNDLWFNVYTGGGIAGVKEDSNGNRVFFMYSNISSSPDESYSGLVVTTKTFSDFEMSVDVKTEKQLRQNNPPNPWEVAWLFFRYTDDQHNYWLILKPSGIELAKKDCSTCPPLQEPTYLFSDNSPKSSVGTWSKLYVKMVGDRITIGVNGSKIVDFVDKEMSDLLRSGVIGLYANDAAVSFDNIYIKPLIVKN